MSKHFYFFHFLMSELVSIFPENGKSHDGYMHRLDLVSFQEHGSLLGMGKRRYKKVFFYIPSALP